LFCNKILDSECGIECGIGIFGVFKCEFECGIGIFGVFKCEFECGIGIFGVFECGFECGIPNSHSNLKFNFFWVQVTV
jgi:hypothetical protein